MAIAEGTTARNPKTGERIRYENGQWKPIVTEAKEQVQQTADRSAPQQAPTVEGVLRGIGIGARDIISGAAALPGLAADVVTAPIAGAYNVGRELYNKVTGQTGGTLPLIGRTSQLVEQGLNAVGLPEAQTDTERMISAGTRGVAGATTGIGLGGAIGATAAPASNAGRLAQMLAAAPRTQIAVGGTAPVAGEVVRQGGGSPGAQLATELGTGIVMARPSSVLKPAGKTASTSVGFTSGVGGRPLEEAAKAGYLGGPQAEAFRENITGRANTLDVVNEAKKSLAQIRAERAADYNSGMIDIKNDATVLDMKPVVAKVNEVKSRGFFKGKAKNASASKTWEEIDDAVKDWNNSNPADFHTPEGLDALKQRIGDIRDSQQFGTPSYNAAKEVYNAIKDQITQQAPTYSKVMRDYSEASDLISQIEGALSLNNKAQADTALRKLQSILRNNAQTNYGRREELGDILVSKGATTLYPALAGQALSSFRPRSISGAGSALTLAAGLSPKTLALLPLTSPRLMGEAAYYGGKVAGTPRRLANALMKRGNKLQAAGTDPDALAAALMAIGAGNAGQQ